MQLDILTDQQLQALAAQQLTLVEHCQHRAWQYRQLSEKPSELLRAINAEIMTRKGWLEPAKS